MGHEPRNASSNGRTTGIKDNSNRPKKKLRGMPKAEPPKVERGQLTVMSHLGSQSSPKDSGTKLCIIRM